MRWGALFDDLEAQLAAQSQLGLESEVSERARVDQAGVALRERLRAHGSSAVTVMARGGQSYRGTVGRLATEWLMLECGNRAVLVPLSAVLYVEGLGRRADQGLPSVSNRLGLASAFRAMARDRAQLQLLLDSGGGCCAPLEGVIDRVGTDHLDFAIVPDGEVRRAANVSAVVSVPFHAITAVSSQL